LTREKLTGPNQNSSRKYTVPLTMTDGAVDFLIERRIEGEGLCPPQWRIERHPHAALVQRQPVAEHQPGKQGMVPHRQQDRGRNKHRVLYPQQQRIEYIGGIERAVDPGYVGDIVVLFDT
jgi:hypothetical protein